MLSNKKNLIFWGGVMVLGLGLVLVIYFAKPAGYGEQTTGPATGSVVVQNPNFTVSPESSSSPQATPRPSATEEPFVGLNDIKAPAVCQISGETDFSDSKLYSSNTKISWQNVDSQGRLINWRISPTDNLAIGPNIFANLTVPNGEFENLTVRLPENPVAKSYLLTASITYGQVIQGDVKVKEVNCSGQVKVNLNF